MHLIQNESRYSIEFRKGHFYRILYLNQYIFSYTDKHLNVFLSWSFFIELDNSYEKYRPLCMIFTDENRHFYQK